MKRHTSCSIACAWVFLISTSSAIAQAPQPTDNLVLPPPVPAPTPTNNQKTLTHDGEIERHIARQQSQNIMLDALKLMEQIETAISISPEATRAIVGYGPETELIRKSIAAIQKKRIRDDERAQNAAESWDAEQIERAIEIALAERMGEIEAELALTKQQDAEPLPVDTESIEGETEYGEVIETIIVPEVVEDVIPRPTREGGRDWKLGVQGVAISTSGGSTRVIAIILDDAGDEDTTILRLHDNFVHDLQNYQLAEINEAGTIPSGGKRYRVVFENTTHNRRHTVTWPAI